MNEITQYGYLALNGKECWVASEQAAIGAAELIGSIVITK